MITAQHILAIQNNDFAKLDYLIQTGRPLTAAAAMRDQYRNTLLHYAALHDQTQISHHLIYYHGIDVNTPNSADQTALHIAAMRGNMNLCQILLGKQASPSTMDQYQETPITLAKQYKHYALADHLVQHLSKQQIPDNRRWFIRINRSASCLEITSIVDNGLLNTKPKLWQLLSNFESSIKTIRIITPTISTDEANQIVASLAVITPKKMSIRFMTEEPSNLLEIHCNHISQEARKIIQQDSRVNVILPKASTSSQPTSFTM